MKKVLVLEDEANIRSFVVINLKRAGYEAIEAETGEEALAQLKRNPDIKVALLDIMLPDMDGFEVCRRIRAGDNNIGIIMLTARTQEMDKVTGLMTGADDYVTKPFSPAELTARIDALYRRTGGGDPVDTGEISQPPFLLNTRNRTLEKNGQRVKLTQVEYSIIKLFMDNPGKALSREEILDSVWGRDYFGELKIVDVNIRRLRIKIEDDPTILLISPPCGDTGISGAFSQRRTGRLRWAPPWGGAARSAVQAFLPEAKALTRGNSLAPGRGKRGVPAKLCFAGHDDPTNPAYITTVWGYGYKWGF